SGNPSKPERIVGTATATLYSFTDVTGSLHPNGQVHHETISKPGQRIRLGVLGNAGQRITISLANVTIPGNFDSHIEDQNGQVIAGNGSVTFFEPIALPTNGDSWTLSITPQGGATGSVDITENAAKSDYNQTLPTDGSTVTKHFVPGQNGIFTFSA